MKVEWLNAEMTEASVTRGVLWWKRRAVLRDTQRLTDEANWYERWAFVPSGNRAGRDLSWRLHQARIKEHLRQKENQDWQPVAKMPSARLLERGQS